MIRTEEDDEFARIEHENEMKKGQPYYFKKRTDDDDIQDYVRPWVGLTNDELTDLFYNTNLGQMSAVQQAIALLKERNS
jgi:hypothetical protein